LLPISEEQLDAISRQLMTTKMQFGHLRQTPLAVLRRQQEA
jgi:hypothetical protein